MTAPEALLPRSIIRSLGRSAALALGLSVLGAPALAFAQDGGGQVERGFALEASIGVRFGVLASAAGTALPGNSPQTGLFAGYKLGRILLGLGLEFNDSTTSTSAVALGGTTTTTTTDASFLIGPEVQAALLRTADSRVELIGDLALHFGHEFVSTSVSPPPVIANNAPTDSNFLLSYAVGPGVRFWAHPHLALQALAGFGGQAFFDIPINNNPATGNHSEHGIFASFGALGVF